MVLFLSILPVILLIWLMVKKNSMPSYIALPITAALIYVIKLFYFDDNTMLLSATAVSGPVFTLTPITVVLGAIMSNHMMETTGCIDVIHKWLATISLNPIAQLMIIGWSFAFMIEGASGFDTPTVITAPILVSLGFNPLEVTIFTLVMNSVPVSSGTVSTPTWFGFAPLNLSAENTLAIGRRAGIIHFFAGFVIPVIGLGFVVPWAEIRKNLGFIGIAVFSCTLPYIALAMVSEEFPSLVAGTIGLMASVFATNRGWGLSKDYAKDPNAEKVPFTQVTKALTPLGMLVGVLVITRIKRLGIKGLLTNKEKWFSFQLPFDLSKITISDSLTITFGNIFGQGADTFYQTLYIPTWIPFVFTVWICILLYKAKLKDAWSFYAATFNQAKEPLFTLMGALIMVQLMMVGSDDSMVKIIGKEFIAMAGEHWVYLSPYLGAIGAFFSGSNTAFNLTFGPIQQQIAFDTGLSVTLILALQSVSDAVGNMACTNNIITVCSVLNVNNAEGAIIKETVIPMNIYGVIAMTIASIFLL